MNLYLDASALVKLVRHEVESEALRRFLRAQRADIRVSSELARVEVIRSVLVGGPADVAQARRLLARVHLLALNRFVLDQAGALAPGSLIRSLDAIHIATAQLLGSDLRAVVTYDQRMVQVATLLGMPVATPR